MKVETNKQELTVNKLISTKTKTIVVEGNMIVPDVKPDILNTIDSVGNICIYKKEVLEGRVRIDGGVNIYSIYLADSPEDIVRGLNTTLDFTQIIEVENCTSEMDAIIHMEIKRIECKVLNGRKINIEVEIEIQVQVCSNEKIEILKEVQNIKNIQTLNSNISMNTMLGSGKTKTPAKDIISYDEADKLVEILKAEVQICNQETKISYHKILLKADANVKIMYLTEDNQIKIISSSIPMVGFIEIPDVEENSIIDTHYEIKNMIIKPNNEEEHSISIDIEVEAFCRVYGMMNIELIQDLYSTEENLKFTTKTVETEGNKMKLKKLYNLEEEINVPEISNNQIYDIEIIPIINTASVLNGKIAYEGEINLNLLYASPTTGGMDAKKYNLPFHFEVEEPCISPNKKVLTQIECIGDNFIIHTEGNIECKVDLQFNISISDTTKLNLIDEIQIEEERNEEGYSMIIYLVKPNDTLWSVAKRNRTTIENIIQLNGLENEKIKAGEKLYISRCSNNNIEMGA